MTDLDTPTPTPLPALGDPVTYEIEPTEICDPVTDALLRYDTTHAGTFGAVVTGVVPIGWVGRCASCWGHWHVTIRTVTGAEYTECPSALDVVDPDAVRATGETHGTPVHTATPAADSTCYRCRDEHDAAAWAAGSLAGLPPF